MRRLATVALISLTSIAGIAGPVSAASAREPRGNTVQIHATADPYSRGITVSGGLPYSKVADPYSK